MAIPTGNTKYWTSTDGNWNTANSWRNQSGATGIPVSGDAVVFSGRRSKKPLLVSPVSAIDLYSWTIEDSYAANLGGHGNFVTSIDSDYILYRGKGSFFYQPYSTCDMMIVNSTNRTDAVFIHAPTPSQLRKLFVTQGKVVVSAMTTQILYLSIGHDLYPHGAIVEAYGGSAFSIAVANQIQGSFWTDRAIYIYGIQNGGTWHMEGPPLLMYVNDGTFIFDSQETMSELYMSGGVVDLLQKEMPKTITKVYKAGGTIKYDSARHSVTFTDLLGFETRD